MKLFRSFSSTLLLFVLGFSVVSYVAYAVVGTSNPTQTWNKQTLIDAQTSSATSNPVALLGARAATVLFSSDGPNGSGNGTTTFSFQVSPDGTNYYTYAHLTTNDTSLTKVSSAAITATSSSIYTMDFRGESFLLGRCISVEAGTTTATCTILVQN